MSNYSKAHICQCLSRLSTARRSSTVMIIGERRKTGMKFVGGDLGLAHGLIQLGLKPGDVVAISALNSSNLYPQSERIMMMMQDVWNQLGPAIATIMFAWTMYQNYFPHELRGHIRRYTDKLVSYIYPYIHITFHEYETDGWFERSKAYEAIERYLSKNSSIQAKRLKANVVKDGQSLVLSMDDHEEVTDDYEGAKVWWISSQKEAIRPTIAWYPRDDENRYFKLKFHRKNRDLITILYLKYVLDEGKAISVRERQRKLYTNNKGSDGGFGGYNRRMWSQVVFEHPSTFNTLAMEPNKKQEIKDDLETFSKSKDYYAKIGKAWKRGYLLYGPPGTGKSSMIAAMANFLQYDVYDLELTAVKDNTELRKLLIDTTTIGGERLIVFTTNFVEKLDPALIRRGRMDKHIELSYCCFESFKVLANNYLDVTSHDDYFPEIHRLLGETNITPADVAESLMPKSSKENADTCLERHLIACDSMENSKSVNKEDVIPEEAKVKLKKLASEWDDIVDPNALDVFRLKGAMTNEVYQIKWPSKNPEKQRSRKVLVRIYGKGVDVFFDRQNEIKIFEFMSKQGQGPRLLGRFQSGRIEEFIRARTLSAPDLRDPEISSLIAAKMREFHVLDMPGPKTVILWDRLQNWLNVAKGLASTEEAKDFKLDLLKDEIVLLEKNLAGNHLSTGCCHNDLQYGNIMMDEETRSITFIDYEYAGYNHVAFDIANHFCEMVADYHTETPHIMDFRKYPGLEERKRFLSTYLFSSGRSPSEPELEKLVQEVEKYTLASHLFWGLWGIISHHVNKIDFDYLGYARQRFQPYWSKKSELLGSSGSKKG
uniref:Uncharacterized protein n=1 Tax=Solanum lycopersicum TaxID=4081 RepID=A0A3Q7F3D3_SOLLC